MCLFFFTRIFSSHCSPSLGNTHRRLPSPANQCAMKRLPPEATKSIGSLTPVTCSPWMSIIASSSKVRSLYPVHALLEWAHKPSWPGALSRNIRLINPTRS